MASAEEPQTPESGETATEQSPLLTEARRPSPRARPASSISAIRLRQARSAKTIVALLCLATFTAASATGFTLMPLTRIIEDILCRAHYNYQDEPIDEKLCKADPIQTRLATVIAVTGAIEAVMGSIGALPWSVAADRIGRKFVIVLALGGIALNLLCAMVILWFWRVFPLQLVWISGLFQLIGGGQAIIAGGVLSILSDIATEEQRATMFLRMHIASLFGSLASPALASLVMSQTGPWPCLLAALCLLVAGAIIFSFVPNDLKKESVPKARPGEFKTIEQLREALSLLKSVSLTLLFLISLTTAPVSLSMLAFLVQFVSKRYGIPIAATGYIQTGYGLANMLFALLIIPWISKLLLKGTAPTPFRMTNERDRDLFLAKWSYGFIIIAAVVLGLAPTLPVFCIGLFLMAMGAGYSSLTRSLISFYIKPEFRSRVFALVGMVEVVGNIYSQPMLAGLFTLGLQLGGPWIGLPYLGVALILVFSLALLFFIRLVEVTEESEEQ
ncbi:MFS general substrate transporter [Thozetella sp. PMI_491]|nr:MFS general substrate transporter [Thozetella sp. PMI_491]